MAEFNSYYFPWVRKGLGTYIDEKESLGQDGMILCRPELTVKSKYNVRHNLPEEGQAAEESTVILEKTVKFNGPGDVLRINTSAVMKVHPEAGSEGFPVQYLPYIEFWEPDFLWRYTPAAENDGKLRPWLALVVCRQEDVRLGTIGNAPYFTFIGDDGAWAKAFPSVSGLHRCAHAQGGEADKADFCRLLGMRDEESLDSTADYVALLIPAYETGRLRGLGLEEADIQEIPAQRPSWDVDLARQKSRKRGLEFPVYYKWFFKTGTDDFDTIARRLKPVGDELKAGLVLDVTDMGEGFSYKKVEHEKSRTSIVMPAATLTMGYKEEPAFPAKDTAKYKTEQTLYDNLNTLLSNNPVFAENRANIQGKDAAEEPGVDDPMVVPPVYGARHVMATELDDKSAPWLEELNRDIHHRAAAGLGRKIVQKHQEELMDRAWKQVEAIQALNQELYERLMSINANKFLQHKTVDKFQDEEDPSKFLGDFMRYLASMKNAAGKDAPSMASILSEAGIPASFAAPSFHHNTEKLARIVEDLDESTLMDHIVKDQLFKFTPEEPVSALSLDKVLPDDAPPETLSLLQKNIYYQNALVYGVGKQYLSNLYDINASPEKDEYAGSYYKTTFNQKPVNLFPALPSSMPSPPLQLPLEPYRLIEYQVKSFCKDKEYSFETIKEALLAFRPYDTPIYPRLYVLEDEDYDGLYKGTEKEWDLIKETENGLAINVGGRKKTLSFDSLILPDSLYDLFFKEGHYSKDSKYSYGSYSGVDSKFYNSGLSRVLLPYPGGSVATNIDGTDYSGNIKIVERDLSYSFSYCRKEGVMADEVEGVLAIRKYIRQACSSDSSVSMIDLKERFMRVARDFFQANDFGGYNSIIFTNREGVFFSRVGQRCVKAYFADTGRPISIKNDVATLLNFLTTETASEFPYAIVSDYLFCSFLYTLLDYPGFFYLFWKKALWRDTMLVACCYLDKIGPWMTAMLPFRIIASRICGDLPDNLNLFLKRSPSVVIVRKSEWDKNTQTRIEGGIESAVRKAIKETIFPKEQAILDSGYEMLVKMHKMQVKRAQEATDPVPVNKESVQKLQESMENKEAYDRMIEVAKTYYEQFYSDEKLRTEYLEELLRSKYPILAYPFFPEPTYYYLNMISDKFIIPGLDEIPMDRIAMFTSNPKFTEAFLSGMNTEMGSEMQWREFPTDRRGSYFRKFWDSESTVEAIRKDEFFDVKPLHLWEGTRLGENHLAAKGNLLIFAIHSDLFKLFPNTHVFLNKAKPGIGKNQAAFDKGRKDPVMETFIRENILLVGFNISIQEALGSPDDGDYGYMLAFEQDLDDLNFSARAEGLNERLNSAETANLLKDKATIFGKHISRFLNA